MSRVLLVALVATSVGRASAAPAGAVVALHVVAATAEAREAREALADLLSRIDIEIADGPITKLPLVDVEIDLSSTAPFVALSTTEPRALICRRALNPQASRAVLIESAAEVAYAAVESRARTLGLLRVATAPLTAGPPTTPPPVTPPPSPQIASTAPVDDAPALRAQAVADPAMPGYGVDAVALAAMQVRGFGAGLSMAGGGAGVTWGLRRARLAPALALGLTYLRPLAGDEPAGPSNLSTLAIRLGATVDVLRFRWVSLQAGPSLAFDVMRADERSYTGPGPGPGPGPGMMMPGPAGTVTGLAIWAGPAAQLSIRIGRNAHVFLAAGVDYQLRQPGPQRQGNQTGLGGNPNGNYDGPYGAGFAPSAWRSSFLGGLAFTLAGRPALID